MITCDRHQESSEGPCAHYIPGGFCKCGDYFRCVEYVNSGVGSGIGPKQQSDITKEMDK
jgi:hypothetical protein